MKKLIAFLTAVMMLISVSGTIYAAPMTSQNDVRLRYNSEFDFMITERDGENNTTVRTFERESSSPAVAMSLASENSELTEVKKAETEAILSALGMEDEFIERLSDEALQQYSTSPQIISTVSYIKTDADGNSTNVTKKEAEEAAAGTRSLILPPHEYDGPTGGTDSYYNYEEDTYMKLVLIVSYSGDGEYKFSVDAIWFTRPPAFYVDAIGACAQSIAVKNSSRYGWYIYTTIVDTGFSVSQEQHTVMFGEGDSTFFNPVQGEWYGSGATFVRPSENGLFTEYINRKAHYEFIGAVRHPSLETNFNVTAAYECATRYVAPTAGLDLANESIGMSIGFTDGIAVMPWRVSLDTYISYVPD